ncbi:ABC transporter substrate-binding protein [Mycolicibacterium litorale]|nr:ABC transporter substrate-binding protein [Mycolicibacterium litorale]MCV7415099.1 amino acid ABC transporter substrate-binding protein [Mycolicibacterium litorale]
MGILRVGVVTPVPPFTGVNGDAGLDIDLMAAIADALGDRPEIVAYERYGDVVDALEAGEVDAAVGGLTASGDRAAFAPPYLITGQALAVDTRRHPHAHSVGDLDGLTVAVQRDSTAEEYATTSPAGSVRVCDHLDIEGCDGMIALAPVLTELTKTLPGVDVVQKGLSIEHIAIAVAEHDQQMLSRITVAQAELEEAGTLQRLRRKWLGNPYADQSLAVH